MKLSAFLAGAFGIVGFVLSLFAGLLVDNPVDTILFKGLMWAAICYAVGYFVGLIAQQVSLEHAQAIAKRVAEADADKERQEAEERARLDAESASQAAAAEPIAAAVAVPQKS